MRRNGSRIFLTVGVVVAVALTYPVVRGPISATIEDHGVSYHVSLWHGGTLVVLYVLVTCGSLLASGRGHVRAWGRSTSSPSRSSPG